MPVLNHFDLPITQERIYERAEEILDNWKKLKTDPEWSNAIFAATKEARKVENQLH